MYRIIGSELRITRGDSYSFALDIAGCDGEPYELAAGDSLMLHIRRHPWDSECALQKQLDAPALELTPAETKTLAFGDYVYDVELTQEDGTVSSIVPMSRFVVLPEVG